jgi:hypothetical protein
MVELVGDFDSGHDVFAGAQRDATIDVLARLVRFAGLDPGNALVFHSDLAEGTTCPGATIDKTALAAAVRDRVAELDRPGPARAAKRLFPREHLAGFSLTQSSPALSPASAEVPEHDAAARDVEAAVREAIAARQRAGTRLSAQIGPREAAAWPDLRPHVINLSRGELSEGHEFSTTPADLDAMLDSIRAYAATTARPRLLLYAHGGLIEERGALEYARTVRPWWLTHGVYPVFFVWESGLLEILRQYIIGPRAWTDVTDTAIEIAAKGPGSLIWGGMKESARRACADDNGNGYPGGARLFADRLADVARAVPTPISVHAAGHSAGAVFHTRLLPVLIAHGLTIETASLLAPAVRVDLFKDKLLPHVERQRIAHLAMFTMEEDAERQDDCWKVYRKSLLYFVSRSFEGVSRKPILGLHESIRKDAEMRALFGIDDEGRLAGVESQAELQLSRAPGDDPNPLTRARRHGAFDNDPYTMSAVLRRILAVDDATELGFADFPWPPAEGRAFELPEPVFATTAPVIAVDDAASATASRAGGRRVALCVGIDDYADRPLRGCVNDARAWGAALRQLGFDVRYLLDRKATRAAILDGLRRLATSARSGDVIVFQYAGHGTQLKDTSGDEGDLFDESIVPIDYADGAFLIDDDIAGVLREVAAGGTVTMFMDCCHSGTISRFAPAIRPVETLTDRVRYLPVDRVLEQRHQEFSARVRGLPAGEVRPRLTLDRETALPGVIQFAACRDDEYAWESDGRGDFTTAATALLVSAAGRGDTNEAFIQAAARAVALRNRQHPMLLPPAPGFRRRPLLAPLVGREQPPMAAGTRTRELAYHAEALARLLRQTE